VHGVLLPLNALHGCEQLDDAALLVGVFLDVFDLFRAPTQTRSNCRQLLRFTRTRRALQRKRTFGERAHHFFQALQFL
jgi:hypothetical protein